MTSRSMHASAVRSSPRTMHSSAQTAASGPTGRWPASSRHAWRELAGHLPVGPLAAVCAEECIVRGEDLTADACIERDVIDLPLRLQGWEPVYPVAEYHAHRAEFPTPA